MFQIAIYVFLAAASSEIFSDNKEVFRREASGKNLSLNRLLERLIMATVENIFQLFLQQNKQMFSILKYFNLKKI